MNSVAQGSIDSTGMLKVQLPGTAEATAYFWLGAGENFDRLNLDMLGKGVYFLKLYSAKGYSFAKIILQ